MRTVDICDLSKSEGDTVYVEGIYSGVVEYWALGVSGGCSNGIQIELDNYIDGKPVPEEYKSLFDSAHNNYQWAYLNLKLVGVYESKRANGYGHLGSNKARFIVTDYVDVNLKDRRNR